MDDYTILDATVLIIDNPENPDQANAQVTLTRWADGYFLFFLYVPARARGEGFGNRILAAAADFAEDVPIYLAAKGFADAEWEDSELEHWYKRHGYVEVPDPAAVGYQGLYKLLVREPNGNQDAPGVERKSDDDGGLGEQ